MFLQGGEPEVHACLLTYVRRYGIYPRQKKKEETDIRRSDVRYRLLGLGRRKAGLENGGGGGMARVRE